MRTDEASPAARSTQTRARPTSPTVIHSAAARDRCSALASSVAPKSDANSSCRAAASGSPRSRAMRALWL